MSEMPRRKSKLNDWNFIYGSYTNWVDLSDNTLYFVQEYHEAIDAATNPQGIRYQTVNGEEGYISEMKLREKMQDPPVDPKYAPETPEEHRRNRA